MLWIGLWRLREVSMMVCCLMHTSSFLPQHFKLILGHEICARESESSLPIFLIQNALQTHGLIDIVGDILRFFLQHLIDFPVTALTSDVAFAELYYSMFFVYVLSNHHLIIHPYSCTSSIVRTAQGANSLQMQAIKLVTGVTPTCWRSPRAPR